MKESDINYFIRDITLNDKTRIEEIIHNSSNSSLHWSLDLEFDILSIFCRNITKSTPERTFGIFCLDFLVGFICFYSYNELKKSIFMGYILDEGYQGRGIMTNSCKNAIFEIFGSQVDRIFVVTESRNSKSKQLIIRLGFEYQKYVFRLFGTIFKKYVLFKTNN